MLKNWLKYLMISGIVLGTGSSAASLQLSTRISPNSKEIVNITKPVLMKGVHFTLSSLNNLDDLLSVSIKTDMEIALAKNYKQVDVSTVDMKFYYGSSILNPEIDFSSNNYKSILYFTTLLHSTVGQFDDTILTFDYRPTLIPFAKKFNGYENANIYVDKEMASFTDVGSLLTDFNTYLNTNYVKNSFISQWKNMGLVVDGLLNSQKISNIQFTKDFIDYADTLGIKNTANGFNERDFDKIPGYMKTNLFKNFDSSLVIGYSQYYKITSKGAFGDIDEKLSLSDLNKNFDDLTLGSFKSQIKEAFRSQILIATGYHVYPSDDDLPIIFKRSYKDATASFDWDTKISDIDVNYLWLELETSKEINPFLDYVDNPGFHIYVNKQISN